MKKNTDILKKLKLETENTGMVHLWLEGMFWKAYERSAYIFSQRIGDYKPYKRWIKAMGGEIVAIGFPSKAFDRLIQGRVAEKIDEKHYVLTGFTMEKQEMKNFQEWKKNIASFPYQRVNPDTDVTDKTSEHLMLTSVKEQKEPEAEIRHRLEKAENIIEEIRRFRMESATPLQCMLFLAGLVTKIENK